LLRNELLYIKTTVVSVCLCGQCLEDSSSHCPFPVVTNRAGQGKAGRPGQPLRGAGRGAILLKKSLGKTGGPASNQTKIQIFKKNIFIVEHI
jgi:hypothetical protein